MTIAAQLLNTRGLPPALLYHYTRRPGLLGILESGVLWATHVRFLNDARDFEYALEILSNVVDAEPSKTHGRRVRLRLGALREQFQHQEPEDDILDHPVNKFVCCFSERGDDLNQWRAYCAVGDAYSVGFDTKALRAAAGHGFFALRACIYHPDRQRLAVSRHLLKWTQMGTESPEQWAIQYIGDAFCGVAPLLKHPSFSEEAEWRLVGPSSLCFEAATLDFPSRFRAGRATIVPYSELRFDPPADESGFRNTIVRELMIGPPATHWREESMALTFMAQVPFRIRDLIPTNRTSVPLRLV